MNVKICFIVVVLYAGAILLAASAQATEQQTAKLNTMTVTANKQEEDLQEVPMSISAIDEVEIEDKNISSLQELADFVPNLALTGQGISDTKVPTTRGLTAQLGTMAVSTGMFIDGVPVITYSGFEDTLLDVKRVEVLRGPQGTLYGKNTEAGAINIITHQPDNNFNGRISVDGGEDYKKELSLNMGGPIVRDTLFFGLTGQYYAKDGFITHSITGDPVNDQERWYGKGQLRWTPTDALDVNLIISQFENNNDGTNMGLSEYGALAFGLTPSGDRETSPDIAGEHEATTSSQALRISYDLKDSLNLTSITTHRHYEMNLLADYDMNPITFMHSDNDSENEKTSQELRLSSNTDKVRWVAGLYYDNDEDISKYAISSVLPSMNYGSHRELNGEAYAVFGQLRYALTSLMGVTGGLRYEYQEKEMDDLTAGVFYDDSWDNIAPKVSLDYSITSEIMGYATVAKGFLSGGFNPLSGDPEHETSDEEELWSYEIGIKSELLDNRLLVNSALFYMDLEGMQVTEYTTASTAYTTNAATATSYGLELEVQAKISEQLTLNGSFGYIKAEFDEFKDALGDYSGNKAPYAPDYTFSLGGKYRSGNGFYAGADIVGYGKMYVDSINTYSRDAYEIVNAKVGYEADSWDIYLYAKNLFDKDYTIDGFAGGYYKLYSDPREIGIKLIYRF